MATNMQNTSSRRSWMAPLSKEERQRLALASLYPTMISAESDADLVGLRQRAAIEDEQQRTAQHYQDYMNNRWQLAHYPTMPVPEEWKPFITASTTKQDGQTQERVASTGTESIMLPSNRQPNAGNPLAAEAPPAATTPMRNDRASAPLEDGQRSPQFLKASETERNTSDVPAEWEIKGGAETQASKPLRGATNEGDATPMIIDGENPVFSPKKGEYPPHLDPKDVDFIAYSLNQMFPDGAAAKSYRMARDMVAIREGYVAKAYEIVEGVRIRRAMGMPDEEIARWAYNERNAGKKGARGNSGPAENFILSFRDKNKKYTTFEQFIEKKMEGGKDEKPLTREQAYQQIQGSSARPNSAVNERVEIGGKVLRYGNRVLLPVAISSTAYRLATAPLEELPRIIAEEGGSWTGSALGIGAAATVALVFLPGAVAGGAFALTFAGAAYLGGVAGGIAGGEIGARTYDFLFSPDGGGRSKLSPEARAKEFSEYEYQGP